MNIMQLLKTYLPYLILLFFSYWAIEPLFSPGFFQMHDDTQVARVFEMHKALTDGMFPVRWVSDLGYGYGYPIFNFYAPFAYYVGAFFQLLGFDALVATKLMIGLGMVLSGITMYVFAKEFWGRIGGIAAGLLYVYAPYHSVNLYVRGAIAELWAYAFIPLAFFGVYKLFIASQKTHSLKKNTTPLHTALATIRQTDRGKWIAIGSLGYAGVILSHNLTAMMVTPFLGAFGLLLIFSQRKKRTVIVFLSIVLGILLSAFYWLPTLFELQYTNVYSQVGGTAAYGDHFVCLSQLWHSFWGFGGSIPGCVDGLSFMLGKLHILLFIPSTVLLFLLWKRKSPEFVPALFFFLSALFVLFLMLKPSQFIWDSIHAMAFLQYPWRLLALMSFFSSFFGGATILFIRATIKFIPAQFALSLLLMIGIVYVNADLFFPQRLDLQATAVGYTAYPEIAWDASTLTDEYLPKGFTKPKDKITIPQSKVIGHEYVVINSVDARTHKIIIGVSAERDDTIALNHAYFPAWHAYIDGKEVPIQQTKTGIAIDVPKGKHTILLQFNQTMIEMVGNGLSLTGVLILILVIIYARRHPYEHKKKKS